MQPQTREEIRNELRILTFRRRSSKEKSKKLQRNAQKYLGWVDENLSSHERYTRANDYFHTIACLRYDGSYEARHYNIAYGLLRGVDYRKIEHKCKEAPSAKHVLKIIHRHIPYGERKDWTVERVTELLK
jgi:hypothetical protein